MVNVKGQVGLRILRGLGADERRRLEAQYIELWTQHGASLGRLASSYEAQDQACEDLLQEIRLAIWTALPRFRGESSVRTFAFRIAHNRALAHVWKRKRSAVSEDLEGIEILDPGNGPDAIAAENFEQQRLFAAIRTLPLPMKQVITLALEEISYREIGEILGLSENNVAVRLNRAKAQLRQKLGGTQ